MQMKSGGHETTADTISTWAMARRLPATLKQAVRLGWQADRRALLALLAAQVVTAVLAAVALATTTTVIRTLLDLLAAYTARNRTSGLLADLVPAACLLGGALAAGALAQASARAAAARLGPRCAREADVRVLQAAAAVEYAAYEHAGFEDELEAAGKGADSARDLVDDAQSMISALAQMCAAVTVLSFLHPALVALLLLAALPRGWAAVTAARTEHTTARATLSDSRLRSVLRNYATDRNTAAEIRTCHMGPFLHTQYTHVSDHLEAESLAATLRALRIQLTGDALSTIALLGAWAALAVLAATGGIDLAAAGTALFALRTSNASLTNMMRAAARLFRTSLFLDDWAAFLKAAHAHRARRGRHEIPQDGPNVISTRALTFTYPGTTSPAVDNVDLDLKRGEVVALVGENGSGKTTLVHLLTGLYLPDTGAGGVRWDGIDLANADPETVWARTAMVPQDYTRWPFRARENITLGSPRPDGDTAVLAAAEASGADTVLARLPDGLDTSLARSWWGGHDLSGGQWQRIALARAFHREGAVRVLDEPTAALDARAEHQVFSRLKALAATDGITLFITHRLANARIADRIIVMNHGHIAETGTYDELLRHDGGLFQELHRLQAGDKDA